MRAHVLTFCGVTLIGVLALAHDSSELSATASGNATTETLSRAAGPLGSSGVALESFQATRLADGRTDLEWRTHEVEHVVFRLYREQNGDRVRIFEHSGTGQGAVARQVGRSYTWRDQKAPRDGAVSYWLEEVDVKGTCRWHGPLVLVAREPRIQ